MEESSNPNSAGRPGRSAVAIPSEEIRAAVEKVLASSDFARSDSLKHFLRHSVELTLDGQTDRLKESLVGVEIFGRSPSFDPRVDPIVRVQAVKLRTRLERYYSKEGQTDPIIVDFPKGGYVPVFHRREPEEIQPAAAVIPARRTGWKLPLAVAGLLIAAGIAVWIWWPGRPAVDARPVFTQVASQPGSTSAFPAISRQGNLLAFASDRGERGDLNIFIQAIGIEEPVQLTYHPAKERQPDFSPDGARIVFQSDRDQGGLYVVSFLSRLQRKIADRGYLPRFSPDGTQIAFRGGDGKLYTVPAHGGEPRLIQTGLSMPITYPLWTPDGKRLLFVTGDEQGEFDWKTVPAEGGQATSTGAGEIFRRFGLGNHVYLPIPGDWVGDRMVFSAGKGHTCTLWRLRFSPRNWQVAGEPEQFTSGPGPDTFPRAAVDAGGRTRIVFSRENRTSNLWSLPFAETGAEQRLTYDPAVLPELSGSSPQLSSNGGLLAFVSERLGNPDVFVRDLKTQAETPVAANAWPEDSVAMCPDGSRLAYLSHNDGHASLLVWEVARTATTKLCEDCGRPVGWTPDGKGLLLDSGVSPGLRILDPATRKVRDILPGIRYRLREASVSPDGKWVAILTRSIQDGCPASFLAPLGSESTESCAGVISLDGLGVIYGANWSADGAWLYFIAAREDFRCVWKVRLDPATGRPAGEPVAVRHFHRHQKFVVAGGGLSIVGGRLAVWLGDSATSVWMAEVLGRF